MPTALKVVLFGIAVAMLVLAFAVSSRDLSDRGNAKHPELTFRGLPLERPEHKLWSPQSEAMIHAFPSRKGDLEELLEKMGAMQAFLVGLLGGQIRVSTKDGSDFNNDTLPEKEQWLELMERAGVVTIFQDERFGMTVVIPEPPRTTPDRNETINYFLNHPYPAKPCSDQFREIPCGVCDVIMGDEWSIRFSWSSGEFESEYSENFLRLYQDDDFDLGKDEIDIKLDKARGACKRRGLEEMGYEDPEMY